MTLLRRILIAITGGGLLAVGVALLVLPGPASVVLPLALAILAIEFVWARRWLAWLRERLKKVIPSRVPRELAGNLDSRITTQTQPK
jgi:hypothetical protein